MYTDVSRLNQVGELLSGRAIYFEEQLSLLSEIAVNIMTSFRDITGIYFMFIPTPQHAFQSPGDQLYLETNLLFILN